MNQRAHLVLLLLVSIVSLVSGQEGFPLFTKDFPPEEFAQRRAAVYEAIGPAALALVQGTPMQDNNTRFRQSADFYYLCGIESPHAYLLLDGSQKRATLFLPHRNEARERSEGKTLSAEDAELIKQLSGIDAVSSSDLLQEQLARFARTQSITTLYTPFAPAEGFAGGRDVGLRGAADIASDPLDGRPSRAGHLIHLLKTRLPHFEVKNLNPIIDNLRLIKSPREIELIRRATILSCEALRESMRSTKPGIYEHELDGVAKFVYYRNGAQGEAYYSLVASGRNAWYPHYNAGKRQMLDGDFLLMDFAPDYGYYMSDITRQWPVNGKFNSWQRELYGFYVKCYRSILKAIRPGVTAQKIKQEAASEMEKILASSRFSKPIYETAAKNFVSGYKTGAQNPRTSLGHWVGMGVHDIGQDWGPLRPGMVFTIEPALRVPEEQIYIRLEDLIVITETGADIISEYLPMDIDGIEKIMREEGFLKRYPKIDLRKK
jgi:Xaa-Pro aminopeptidase